MNQQKKVKLHLGCQQKYLEGYVNIDLPPKDHTVQQVKADIYADIRELQYDDGSIDEVRSHHLLEHFTRQEALALLAQWHRWLKVGGLLVVETPDFNESIKKFIAADLHFQFQLGRHIFGSQEAPWAQHYDFWSEPKFRYVLDILGFGEFNFKKFSNNLEQKFPILKKIGVKKFDRSLRAFSSAGIHRLPNIVCYAKKIRDTNDYRKSVKEILKLSLVGREDSAGMLDVWMKDISGYRL